MRGTKTAMKVTTVRFGPDLWALLEHEASLVGVSVSHYIREAALARAAAAAARRQESPFELLAGGIREVAVDHPDPNARRAAMQALAALARLTAAETFNEATALAGQSEQAQREAVSKQARSAALTRRRRDS